VPWEARAACPLLGPVLPAVDELKDVAKSLRRLPVVEPNVPTVSNARSTQFSKRQQSFWLTRVHALSTILLQVALVGAPNVGKSSLVQLLSSGLPEVQNYPFTTRSIKMGHFYVVGRRHQVTGGSRQGCERPRRECVLHDCTAVACLVSGAVATLLQGQHWARVSRLSHAFAHQPQIPLAC
jgi:hypothetical protein